MSRKDHATSLRFLELQDQLFRCSGFADEMTWNGMLAIRGSG